MQGPIGLRNDGAKLHRMDVITGFVRGRIGDKTSAVEQPIRLIGGIKVNGQIVLCIVFGYSETKICFI